MKNVIGIIGGVAIGAGAMYLADPTAGNRRRAVLRDRIIHLGKVLNRTANIASRDTSNRFKGIVEEAKKLVKPEFVDDAKLLDRVRAAVGRVSSHPNVEVIVADGHITLLGPVVDHEERAVLRAAKSVRGVHGVTNRMRPYRRLQSEETEQSEAGHWFDVMRAHWSPATRIVIGAIGVSSAIAGFTLGGSRGVLIGAAGSGLAARAASNYEFSKLVGITSDTRRRAA